jgi:hypothetical protein
MSRYHLAVATTPGGLQGWHEGGQFERLRVLVRDTAGYARIAGAWASQSIEGVGNMLLVDELPDDARLSKTLH